MSGSLTVHVRVNDVATGQPTPCRLRIAGLNGEYYPPFGRQVEFPLGRNEEVGGQVSHFAKEFAFIDGSCEIRLPSGVPLDVEITKGLEYEPCRERITLGPGKMSLRFGLKRWVDSRSDGWLSADTRCHFLSPHSALLEAGAEDVAMVHLLATEQEFLSRDGDLYSNVANMTAFSGQVPALESKSHAVVVNTFNTHPVLGRLGLLNCHRPVFPLSFGRARETDDWSLNDWCDQCHRKKGLVVWSGAYRGESGLPGGEALVALILGKVDAVEIDAYEGAWLFLPKWFDLLDAGFEIPLVGSSGKDSNRLAIGSMRTHTLMEAESRSLGEWVEQTRRGRTFVTNGPLVDLSVNGNPVGSRLSIANSRDKLAIAATARSIVPFDDLEVVANGKLIAKSAPTGWPLSARIELETILPEGGWITARCTGTAKSELYPQLPVCAHSSPTYVRVEGRPPRATLTAIRSLRPLVEGVRKWVETTGRFEQEKSKDHLLGLCDEALAALNKREAQSTGA